MFSLGLIRVSFHEIAFRYRWSFRYWRCCCIVVGRYINGEDVVLEEIRVQIGNWFDGAVSTLQKLKSNAG